MVLILRPPAVADEIPVRSLHDQLLPEGFEFLLAEGAWGDVLDAVAAEAAGVDLAPGRVRAEFLLAEVDGVVVGRTSIRYGLTDHLRRVGGHVGYAVGPAFRHRGYATEILKQSLDRLRDNGIQRVLVTCDENNIASARTIERCGGVLESIDSVEGGARKRRYWIGP